MIDKFEESDFKKLTNGSMEERLTVLSDAIVSDDRFGTGSLILSSFDDYIIAIDTNGNLFKVEFIMENGDALLGKAIPLTMDAEKESSNEIVEKFINGENVSSSLKDLVVDKINDYVSPYRKIERELSDLFSDENVWLKYVNENKLSIVKNTAKEPLRKSISNDRFYYVYAEGNVSEEDVDAVTHNIISLENDLGSMLSKSKKAYSIYKNKMDSDDSDVRKAMMHFESFSNDFLKHLESISNLVSRSIRLDCVECAAMVFDRVADQFENLVMGSRVVRMISEEFVSV